MIKLIYFYIFLYIAYKNINFKFYKNVIVIPFLNPFIIKTNLFKLIN